ncbi:MAG: DUF2059 domain-containing protein [Desulfobacula sp.]|jgi:hypothetical protein|nr:DUF2059 domain-containing protein [Desulfobacula sp.]
MKNLYQKSIVSLLSFALILWGLTVFADQFSDKAKISAIERYLQIMPVQELLDDMAIKVSRTLPENNREAFIDLMTKKFDIELLESAMIKSMYKHYTLSEIEALTNFYSKPEGKSIMKKMGDYMADVMPIIQSEMIRITREGKQKQ